MGSINIDNTGSGGAITLSSDGTSLLLGGSAVGGGADLYAANESSPAAQPSATGANAVAIGDQAIASGDDSLAFGEHSDATATRSYAFGFGAVATNTGALALGTSRAFAGDALAINIDNNSTSYGASGANSIAIGSQTKANTIYSVSIGQANTVSGNRSAVVGGRQNNAGSDNSGIFAGASNTTSNQYAFIGAGFNNVASGVYSAIIGGYDCVASELGSYATGMWANSLIKGKWAHGAAGHLGSGAMDGGSQSGHYVLISNTTDATAEALTSDNGTAGTSNQVILFNNSAYSFSGTIVARQQAADGTACAAWKVEGLIRREGSAGTTVLVNSATTVLDNTPNWGMALSADTTNGGLAITVTGAASTNIRWVATIHTSEVTYA